MTTADRVREIVRTELGCAPDEMTSSAQLQTDLGADSLDLTTLQAGLEDEFWIQIPNADMAALVTVRHVIDYIETHIVAGANSEAAR